MTQWLFVPIDPVPPAAARRARRLAMLGLGFVVAAGPVVAIGAPAAAATVNSSSPSSGQHLSAAPGQVRITFDQILIFGSATISVSGPGGAATQGATTVIGATATRSLRSGLGPGTYRVTWQVAASFGQNAAHGGFSFVVSTQGSGGKPRPKPSATHRPPRATVTSIAAHPSPTPGGSASLGPAASSTATGPSPSAPVASPDVAGVSDQGSGVIPPPVVIWAGIAVLALAGWVVFKIRKNPS